MTDRKTVSSLLPQEMYEYCKNHYVPTSNEVLLQKEYLMGGTKKKLSEQLSWLKSWHVYSKELEHGLCKVCILFDENKTSSLRVSCVKNDFYDFTENEGIETIKENEKKRNLFGTLKNQLKQ